MRLPNSTKKTIRKYEFSLSDKKYSYNERLYTLFLLLSPSLDWLRTTYQKLNLSAAEIESEIYVIIDDLFKNFNRTRSSIIPYIENSLGWYISSSIENLKKDREIPSGLIEVDSIYYLDEEFYFSAPKIFNNNRYIKKHLTKDENYIIYRILISDNDRLSTRKLAEDLDISRENLVSKLKNIKQKLINGGYNDRN